MNGDIGEMTPDVKNGKRKIRNDIIFIVALLLIVSLVGAGIFFLRGEGDRVRVEVNGKLYGEYLLSENRRVEIRTGESGEELNILVIKDGRAHVESATCPDGICSEHRAVFRDGESIVCLPHKVVITVYSSDADSPDVIV